MDRDLLKALHRQAVAGERQAMAPVGRIAHQIVCLQRSIQARDGSIAAASLFAADRHMSALDQWEQEP